VCVRIHCPSDNAGSHLWVSWLAHRHYAAGPEDGLASWRWRCTSLCSTATKRESLRTLCQRSGCRIESHGRINIEATIIQIQNICTVDVDVIYGILTEDITVLSPDIGGSPAHKLRSVDQTLIFQNHV
jgi:nicotinate-nucleotide pyrophosphorylase